jgi:hypothetical protein
VLSCFDLRDTCEDSRDTLWTMLTEPLSTRPGQAVERRRRLTALLRVQGGVVCRRQLLQLPVCPSWIDHRLASGEFLSVFNGVYAVGHDRLTQRGRFWAAVLAGGPNAFLSHRSAAHHWGFASPGRDLEVVRTSSPDPFVPADDSRSDILGRLVIHRSRVLDESQTTRHHGIPVTTVARTFANIAAVMSDRQLESCLTEAERIGLIRLQEIRRAASLGKGWKGIGRLRSVLHSWDPTVLDTRSDLEREFLAACRDQGLPVPALNVMVLGLEVDCFWPEARLVLELDSYAHHRSRSAFERDRWRDLALQAAGYRALRMTHRYLTTDPDGAAGQVKAVLSLTSPDLSTGRAGSSPA